MDATQAVKVYSAVRAAIEQQRPLSVVYATGGDIIRERVIRPERILIGKHGSDLIQATDSLREGVLTFRVDRVVAVSSAVKERM